MSRRMVLFIDGPLRGRLAECDRPPAYLPESPLDPALVPFSVRMPEPKFYHFHRIALFGRIIWLGSVKDGCDANVIDSSHDDLWELVVSSAARQAEQPR